MNVLLYSYFFLYSKVFLQKVSACGPCTVRAPIYRPFSNYPDESERKPKISFFSKGENEDDFHFLTFTNHRFFIKMDKTPQTSSISRTTQTKKKTLNINLCLLSVHKKNKTSGTSPIWGQFLNLVLAKTIWQRRHVGYAFMELSSPTAYFSRSR